MRDVMAVRSGPCDLRGGTTRHLVLAYLGRRGLGRFTMELAGAIAATGHVHATFCIPQQHEIVDRLADSGCRVLPLDAPLSPGEPSSHDRRLRALWANIAGELTRQRSAAMVTLMPDVWTPRLAPLVRRHGIRYLTIVHDAPPHPRDPARLLNGWALRDAQSADAVVTLSRSVADRLVATGAVPRDKIVPLFHPDLGPPPAERRAVAPDPFRVLAFTPVLPPAHTGLAALVDAIAMLRAEGLRIELGLIGDGPLGLLRPRLEGMGAEVQNRWIAEDELPAILARYHAVALCNDTYCRSAVAATALGAGLPLIGTAEGMSEHLRDGAVGEVATSAAPADLARVIRRIATDNALYAGLCAHIRRTAWERSMRRFAEHLVALAVDALPLPHGLPRRELTWV